MTDEEKNECRVAALERVAFGVYHGLARILSDESFVYRIGNQDAFYLRELANDLKEVLHLYEKPVVTT